MRLELQYLYAIGRVPEPALSVIDAMQAGIGLKMCRTGFMAVAREAELQPFTQTTRK
ncbi:hypothetical protein [Nitrococcus mobilis]|uniref:Uncharacterized protein n=1 Tax=Nitrococcus mobilis Nb-231 TaxID=314278 RepID=A4BVH4_9GAMM|nr:hypothetical protein [Nitrococcus mobilis]EAR20294.1 hypothetical protein NB231_13706 [Nitrococcus mobilis Nb-231]